MTTKPKYFREVDEDDDPNFDYEYYENTDFGDEMEEADKRGELFRGWELGGADIIQSLRNKDAILAAKRAGITKGPLTVPYPPCPAAESFPNRPSRPAWLPQTTHEPEEELCVAEDKATYGDQT